MLAVLLISFWALVNTLFGTSAEKDFIYFVISSFGIPDPERYDSFIVPLVTVKRWTCDKATTLGNFSPVPRLCQSQTTDIR